MGNIAASARLGHDSFIIRLSSRDVNQNRSGADTYRRFFEQSRDGGPVNPIEERGCWTEYQTTHFRIASSLNIKRLNRVSEHRTVTSSKSGRDARHQTNVFWDALLTRLDASVFHAERTNPKPESASVYCTSAGLAIRESGVPVERRVALKIIKPGMDSRQVIARFEAERQAVAMMEHTRILPRCSTPAQRTPAGRTLSWNWSKACRTRAIAMNIDSIQDIGWNCLKWCATSVQHAHQKGIIHRDIKPSNVLVAEYDDQPVPKVIDFGVAKATQRLTDKTMFTEIGTVVGTIEYMSPEQAKLNQLDIDTRSDIYSLGVREGCPSLECPGGLTRQQGRSTAFSSGLHLIDWNRFDSRQLAPISCRGADEPDWASVSRNCMCGVRILFPPYANELQCRKPCEKNRPLIVHLYCPKPLPVWKGMGSP